MHYFTHQGFQYRTNSDYSVIEGKDGEKWNRTYNLNMRAVARDSFSGKCIDRISAAPLAPQKSPTQAGKKFGKLSHVSID